MHLKRWITSLVALPLLILLIVKGGTHLFAILIVLVCILALWEFFHIVSSSEDHAGKWIIPILATIAGPLIIWFAHLKSFKFILSLMAFNLLASGLISLPQFKFNPDILKTVYKQMLAIVYIPILLCHLVLIRDGGDGIIWIFLLICIVFAGDSAAFYVGSYWGRHKLCPAVSPGKTVEGAIGGLLANTIAGGIIKHFFLSELPWIGTILLCLSIGIAGQVGDLFESELKRAANVKDSGTILPGHGGILDRIDALLFAAPVAYFFRDYIFV
jgi:phosphatidate cytidylyltransferase